MSVILDSDVSLRVHYCKRYELYKITVNKVPCVGFSGNDRLRPCHKSVAGGEGIGCAARNCIAWIAKLHCQPIPPSKQNYSRWQCRFEKQNKLNCIVELRDNGRVSAGTRWRYAIHGWSRTPARCCEVEICFVNFFILKTVTHLPLSLPQSACCQFMEWEGHYISCMGLLLCFRANIQFKREQYLCLCRFRKKVVARGSVEKQPTNQHTIAVTQHQVVIFAFSSTKKFSRDQLFVARSCQFENPFFLRVHSSVTFLRGERSTRFVAQECRSGLRCTNRLRSYWPQMRCE